MIQNLHLYSKLLELPLFQGMSRDDLATVIGYTKFSFMRLAPRETLAQAGDECTQLHFLIDGKLAVESRADDNGYTLTEQIAAPTILQPECLFGLQPRFTRTFIAAERCNILVLSKDEVLRLTSEFIIFKFNMLNILSTQAQKAARVPWRHVETALEQRIAQFILTRCIKPAGEKMLHIKMVKLADELNDSRIDISHALNRMQTAGQIRLHRGRIEIPAAEKLV